MDTTDDSQTVGSQNDETFYDDSFFDFDKTDKRVSDKSPKSPKSTKSLTQDGNKMKIVRRGAREENARKRVRERRFCRTSKVNPLIDHRDLNERSINDDDENDKWWNENCVKIWRKNMEADYDDFW
jgi:hypothetical protein